MQNSQETLFIDVGKLTPNDFNPRIHSQDQLSKLEAAVLSSGVIAPVIIDEKNVIIAGEARHLVAQKLGFAEVPALRVHGLTRAQKIKLALADNRITELGGWDQARLRLAVVEVLDTEIEFEPLEIGFDDAEVDILLSTTDEAGTGEEEEPLPDLPETPITQVGDLWQLGDHLLLCGSALEEENYCRLIGDQVIDVVVTDPPYNVPIQGFVGGKGKHKHREFAEASGEMSRKTFKTWIRTAFTLSSAALKDGGLYYAYIDWRGIGLFDAVGRKVIGPLLTIATWVKPNGGMGGLYRSRHEFCAVFRKGKAPHRNNVKLGRYGRNRTNVWEYAGQSSFGAGRDETLALHPTVKPTPMIADILLDCTKRGEAVLDPFAGSGTIFLAAEETGRKALGIEIDPIYCDVALQRWQQKTGKIAKLAATGETFDEVKAARLASNTSTSTKDK